MPGFFIAPPNNYLSGKYLPLRKISTSQENIFLRGNYLQVGDSVLAIIQVIITPGVIIRGGEGLKTPIYGRFLRFFPFYALNAY